MWHVALVGIRSSSLQCNLRFERRQTAGAHVIRVVAAPETKMIDRSMALNHGEVAGHGRSISSQLRPAIRLSDRDAQQ